MSNKTGRNDPCPCGSGKKYKQCCADPNASLFESEKSGHDGAVERAIGWLVNKHRKAFGASLDEMLFNGVSDDERLVLESQDA